MKYAKTVIAGVIATWLCAGCCHMQPAFVPVPVALYRTEVSINSRLPLPLSNRGRDLLSAFLKSGQNPALDDTNTQVGENVPSRYDALLDLLSRPQNLTVANLVVDEKFSPSPLFQRWFPSRAIREIIDARENAIAQRQPYAFLDSSKQNWWVFYHENKQLTQLMVIRAIEPKKPK